MIYSVYCCQLSNMEEHVIMMALWLSLCIHSMGEPGEYSFNVLCGYLNFFSALLIP